MLSCRRRSAQRAFCFSAASLVVAVGCVAHVAGAQTPAEVLARPDVARAMEIIKQTDTHYVDEQIRLCEIASPPFHEDKRGVEVARLFREAGLANVHIDKAGNVLGDRPGAQAHPLLVLAAHLDTVFPEGTDVHVTRTGNMLKGPGIGDDCRGLAAVLSVIHAMQEAKLKTTGSVTFVADVGEEGLGDLRGMKELFGNTLKGKVDDFISIEPGEPFRLTNEGVGSFRYKVTFKGPGGHSYGAFGLPNPVGALGRAVAHIDAIVPPAKPKTTFNEGVIGGGTSVNSIPFEAWFEFDERSADVASLKAMDEKFKAAVQQGLDEENARWNKGKLTVTFETLGVRPPGQTDRGAPIVTTAAASIEALGFGEPS
jgi:tripeptide aminopeptidase